MHADWLLICNAMAVRRLLLCGPFPGWSEPQLHKMSVGNG